MTLKTLGLFVKYMIGLRTGRGRGVHAASTGDVTAGAGQLTEDQRAHQFALDKAEAAARQVTLRQVAS